MSIEPCPLCGNYHPGLDECPPPRFALCDPIVEEVARDLDVTPEDVIQYAYESVRFPNIGPWPPGGGFVRMGSGRIAPVLSAEDCRRIPCPLPPECPCLWGEPCNPEIHCPECGENPCRGLHGSD